MSRAGTTCLPRTLGNGVSIPAACAAGEGGEARRPRPGRPGRPRAGRRAPRAWPRYPGARSSCFRHEPGERATAALAERLDLVEPPVIRACEKMHLEVDLPARRDSRSSTARSTSRSTAIGVADMQSKRSGPGPQASRRRARGRRAPGARDGAPTTQRAAARQPPASGIGWEARAGRRRSARAGRRRCPSERHARPRGGTVSGESDAPRRARRRSGRRRPRSTSRPGRPVQSASSRRSPSPMLRALRLPRRRRRVSSATACPTSLDGVVERREQRPTRPSRLLLGRLGDRGVALPALDLELERLDRDRRRRRVERGQRLVLRRPAAEQLVARSPAARPR